MPRKDLSGEYLEKLKKYYDKYKNIPSFESIKEILDLKSKGSINKLFKKLIDRGYFEKDGNTFIPLAKFLSDTIYGSIKAGFAEKETEDKYEIDLKGYLINSPDKTIMITVRGDSMIDAGILEGDIVVVEKGQNANIGDIVVGVVDEEYTLKYLEKDKSGKHYLKPANQNYPNIYPEESLEIFGTVNSVIRKIK